MSNTPKIKRVILTEFRFLVEDELGNYCLVTIDGDGDLTDRIMPRIKKAYKIGPVCKQKRKYPYGCLQDWEQQVKLFRRKR